MKVINVVGARPNFMKVAPIHRALCQYPGVRSLIVHTGQHFDTQMSDVFFGQLKLPSPDYSLDAGGANAVTQVAVIMQRFAVVLETEKPDLVVVTGDVNSSLACALAAAKCNVPVAHVEAGLRSGDRRMPEELNRIVTDALSDHLFATEHAAVQNLLNENIPMHKIRLVGNVMIDSLVALQTEYAACSDFRIPDEKPYILLTMHWPSNVDDPRMLATIVSTIKAVALHWIVVFPVHPRTLKNLEKQGWLPELDALPNLLLLPPQGYAAFCTMLKNALAVVTDSGGVQEEATFLKIPCITLRENTERPVTVSKGSNVLLFPFDGASVVEKIMKAEAGRWKTATIPEAWDGFAAKRIAAILIKKYNIL